VARVRAGGAGAPKDAESVRPIEPTEHKIHYQTLSRRRIPGTPTDSPIIIVAGRDSHQKRGPVDAIPNTRIVWLEGVLPRKMVGNRGYVGGETAGVATMPKTPNVRINGNARTARRQVETSLNRPSEMRR
jgi:hypothetical protein